MILQCFALHLNNRQVSVWCRLCYSRWKSMVCASVDTWMIVALLIFSPRSVIFHLFVQGCELSLSSYKDKMSYSWWTRFFLFFSIRHNPEQESLTYLYLALIAMTIKTEIKFSYRDDILYFFFLFLKHFAYHLFSSEYLSFNQFNLLMQGILYGLS